MHFCGRLNFKIYFARLLSTTRQTAIGQFNFNLFVCVSTLLNFPLQKITRNAREVFKLMLLLIWMRLRFITFQLINLDLCDATFYSFSFSFVLLTLSYSIIKGKTSWRFIKNFFECHLMSRGLVVINFKEKATRVSWCVISTCHINMQLRENFYPLFIAESGKQLRTFCHFAPWCNVFDSVIKIWCLIKCSETFSFAQTWARLSSFSTSNTSINQQTSRKMNCLHGRA